MNTSNKPVVTGCSSIAESLMAKSILSGVIDDLVGTTEFTVEIGIKPTMPSPMVSPKELVYGKNITSSLGDLPCNWIQVERLDRYGVYYRFIALFGDRHWVTCDRSGHQVLRVFSEPF